MQVRYSIAFNANQLGFEFNDVDKWYKVIDETHGELVDKPNGNCEYIPAPTIEQMCDYLDSLDVIVRTVSRGMVHVPVEGGVELFYSYVKDNGKQTFLHQFEGDNIDDVLQNTIEWILNTHEKFL